MVLGTTLGCSFVFKVFASLIVAVLPIELSTNSGESISGDFSGVGQSTLRVDRDGEIQDLAFGDLLSLKPTEVNDATGPSKRVTLAGGSKIAAQDISLEDDTLTVEPRRQNELRIPASEVKSIRFRAASPALDPQWLGLLEKETRGDVLAIRRGGDRLDPAEGVIESVKEGKVGFRLDGDTLQAPIERLEGVIFGGTRESEQPAEIQVVDIYGSRWSAVAMLPSGPEQPLRLKLSDSVTHEIPLQHIESIRWSGGLTMIATQEPAATSYQSYLAPSVDETLLSDWFGPRPSGKSDLLMQGDSFVEYRIDEGFHVLAGSVRRDESVVKSGKVVVRIKMDGKTVWDEQLTDSDPRGFELSLESARRFRIEVDTAQDGDVGDTVRILRPRLLK